MKVKVLRNFRDRENALRLRKEGDTFEVEEKRARELEGRGFVEITAGKSGKEQGR
ncbi:hypothetical protein [Extibacter muris]|uniref:hypothetical protein n=1 Tax=Extibacter muris TaxID=1796622 RepID=UPI00142D778A|nr:hypothetical protein [Extibacter muris]MCU0079331.1 hypothetical protein [Extibacter muris]